MIVVSLEDYSKDLSPEVIEHLSVTYNGSKLEAKLINPKSTKSPARLLLTDSFSSVYLVLHPSSNTATIDQYSKIPTTHIPSTIELVDITDTYAIYTHTPSILELSEFESLKYPTLLETLKDYRFQFREILRQLHHDSSQYLSTESKLTNYFDTYPDIRSLKNYPKSVMYSESKSRLVHVESIILELIDKYEKLSLKTPCNNLMTVENLVITSERVSIVSWSESGLNDPSYDYAKLLLSPQVETAKNYSSTLNNLLIDFVDRDSESRGLVDDNFRLKLLVSMILIDYEDSCNILSSKDPKDFTEEDYNSVVIRVSRMEKFIIESRTSLDRFMNIHVPLKEG